MIKRPSNLEEAMNFM